MKEKPAIFILKVLALSLFLYVLWYWKVEGYYLPFFKNVFKHLFGIFGIRIKLFWYSIDTFNNLIPFISLMLMTKDIQLKKRLLKLGIGILILISTHILFSLATYLLYQDSQTSPTEFYYILNTFLSLSSKVLPFFLWVILAKKNLLNLFIPKKVFVTL